MTLFRTLLSGAAIVAFAGAPAFAQETATEAPAEPTETAEAPADVSADTVLATVNGQDITLGHLIVARARLPQEYQAVPADALFTGLLDQMIQQIALGSSHEDGLSRGSELALENERRAFLAGEALSVLAADSVTDEALNALYEERYANAEPTQEYNASHILVETEEEAQAIREEIEGGADFAEVAREKSTGPSGPNGGELGWFSDGMMVEPFEAAVKDLEAGEVAGPVQTQFGWHVIKLNESRVKEAPPMDEVRAELTEEIQRRTIEDAVAQATESAEVSRSTDGIDPEVINNLDLVQN